jgi:uncharacterized protein
MVLCGALMTKRLTLATSDGEKLEARWDFADDPRLAVLFCHPHPLEGGSMNAPLMISVTTRLVERGIAVLRFNFRGTGASSGTHDEGNAEVNDITAAYQEARAGGLQVGLAGWSFGAATALRWLSAQNGKIPYVGIAPSARRLPASLPPGPKRIIAGTRDQVVDTEEIRRYAERQSIDLVLTPGDHFFHGRGKKVGSLVAQGFEG